MQMVKNGWVNEYPTREIMHKYCIICHHPFVVRVSGRRNQGRYAIKYCSDRCRKAARTAQYHARRAEQSGNEDEFEAVEWLVVLQRSGGRCEVCGRDDEPLTVDHIIPLADGGPNTFKNLRACCQKCNSKNAPESRRRSGQADGRGGDR